MRLPSKECYFYFTNISENENKIEVNRLNKTSLKSLQHTSRLSPVFSLSNPPCNKNNFTGIWYISIFGPCHPWDFYESVTDFFNVDCVWIGFGFYNIIHATEDENRAKTVRDWISNRNYCGEFWSVNDGIITRIYVPKIQKEHVPFDITPLLSIPKENTLHIPLIEHMPLMSTLIKKIEIYASEFSNDLIKFHNNIMIDVLDRKVEEKRMFDILTATNVALSRFSSQLFSGINPIKKTPCNIISHSLFGIGITLKALWNVKKQIEEFFEEMMIPERLMEFKSQPAIDINRPSNDAVWNQDYLAKIPLKKEDFEFQNMIPYYSGRDGFKSSSKSISAPLSSIEASNMQAWSLITTTHEMVHRITDACIGILYKELKDEDISEIFEKYKNNELCENLMDSVKLLFIKGLASISTVNKNTDKMPTGKKFPLTPSILKKTFKAQERIINEIITHIMDYRFFYEQNPSLYIRALWDSWDALPYITDRLDEYLLRTICALMSNHLDRENNLQIVRSELTQEISKYLEQNNGNVSIRMALENLIKDAYWEKLSIRVTSFLPIIRLTSTFLFSENMAARYTQRENLLTGKSGGAVRNGYPLRINSFQPERITNLLRFILRYADSHNFDRSKSLWLLYQLAFAKG